MASVPSIRIDLSTGGAGTTGQSRTDAVNAETVTLVDTANASGSYTWTLVKPDGSSSTLSSATAASPTFTIDVAHGSYLIFCEVDGVRSYSQDATGAKISTQGGLAVLKNGFRKPVAGETTQFDSDEGWSKTLDDLLDDITGLHNPTEGEILYADSNGEWATLAPGTSGNVLQTNGAGAPPSWETAGGGVSDHGALTGLADDDHTQYLLIDGSRAMTGNMDLGTNHVIGEDGSSLFYLGNDSTIHTWFKSGTALENKGTVFVFSPGPQTSHTADANLERAYFAVANHGVNFPGGGGAIVKNRSILVEEPYLSADAAQTITTAATFVVQNKPNVGANITITNNYALWVEAGATQLDDDLGVDGDITVTGTVDGRDVASDGTKLDGIEALADVTDATNVAAAGAVMDSDISAAEGFLRKTGAGAYEAIKTNLGAAVAPGASDDSDSGYAVGSLWIDTTGDDAYLCVDATGAAAVWVQLDAGGVSGPGSSTDTAVVIWDGVGGDTLAEASGVTIDGSNNVTTTGVFLASSGSANAPGFAFSANADVGLFLSGNELHMTPNGGSAVLKLATTALYPTSGIDLGVAAAPFDYAFFGNPTRWTSAGTWQTTVGAAGGADTVPSAPDKYLKVIDDTGATLVVPAFAAS